MKVGTVTGKIWTTRRLEELPNGALLEIDLIEDNGSVEKILAFDPLGAGEGERVVVTQGSVAKGWFQSGDAVIDSLVIGIVDEPGTNNDELPGGIETGRMAQARNLADQLPADKEYYVAEDLAMVLNLAPTTLRKKLRNQGMGIGSGQRYRWNRQEAIELIAKLL